MAHRKFADQLKNLRRESASVARFVYAGEVINYSAAQSQRLLQRLNETAVFWMTVQSAMQTSAYIGLGRVFGRDGKYTLDNLLKALERDLEDFQRPALSRRKWNGVDPKPEWLEEYLDSAYYPTQNDVAKLRALVEKHRKVYRRAVEGVRNQYFAHRAEVTPDAVSALFGKGTIRDICSLARFLVWLHDALHELHVNGRKPVLRIRGLSAEDVLRTVRSKRRQGAALEPHEIIARDVDDLMDVLPLIKFNEGKRRKRL